MSIRIVTDISDIDREDWDRFVYAHPQGNVFQTSQMFSVFNATRNHQPVFVAYYEDNILAGMLFGVVQKEYKGLLGKVSSRSIIWGGPLVRNNDIVILNTIINEYDRLVKKNVVYSQIRNIFSMNWATTELEKNGYQYEDHLDILNNLDKPVETLWKDIHPTRRKQIERGYRRGVEFYFIQTPNEAVLTECYELISSLYRRIKLPIPQKELFTNSYIALNNKNGLFILKFNDRIIGCRFVLLYKKMIYDWYAGSADDFLDKYPNDILPWEIMKWGAENGYTIFDFGGAGKPGVPYGVRDFKLKFGGELINLGRFQNIYKPITMNVAKLGFRAWQLLKK